MKIRRPRTLLGMVLMGLAFVTVPLLVAIGNAMVKLGQLAAESEVVLADSATATLENQRLANSLERMERTVRQYFLLQNVASSSDSLTLYDGDQAAFESSIAALRALPSDAHDSRAACAARVRVEGSAPRAARRPDARAPATRSSSVSAC